MVKKLVYGILILIIIIIIFYLALILINQTLITVSGSGQEVDYTDAENMVTSIKSHIASMPSAIEGRVAQIKTAFTT